jgi:uncharacterized membrane protein YeaQ/YmgE (transglycosylase-associated protein family)
MPKEEEKLKLEDKIDRLSEQLHATGELVFNLHQILLKTYGELTETLEKSQQRMYYRGLIMGLLLGIIGNFMVSYLIKSLEGLDIAPWGWALGYVASFLGVFLLVWLLERESKKYK